MRAETASFTNYRRSVMFMPAWKLFTLPRVLVGLPQWPAVAHTFRNLDTTVHIGNDGSHLHHGQVMWGTNSDDNVAGIAWDWRELQENVVAMCDPMAVQSNIELLDECDKPMTEAQQLLYLNRVIHSLTWQDHVCALWRPQPGLRHAASCTDDCTG